MKKTLILLSFVALTSFQTKEEPKLYVLRFTEAEIQALGYVIDNTTAPHNTVKGLTALINKQLQSQIDTTEKK